MLSNEGGVQRYWASSKLESKRRPRVAGGGENIPLQITRCLSEWYSVLEERGTVPGMFDMIGLIAMFTPLLGTSLGSLIGALMNLEDSLTCKQSSSDMSSPKLTSETIALEKILTTPLPL